MFVAPETDLAEAAYQISADNAVQVKQWQADGRLGAVTDTVAIASAGNGCAGLVGGGKTLDVGSGDRVILQNFK